MSSPKVSTSRRLRVEWKPQDCWIGVFWKRRKWWGGFIPPVSAIRDEVEDDALVIKMDDYTDNIAHHSFDVWICILPMLPIHYHRTVCPRPDLCVKKHDWEEAA